MEILRARTIEWIQYEYFDKYNEELRYDFGDTWDIYEVISLKSLFGKSSIYHVLPAYYIYKLSKNEFSFGTLSKDMQFNRIISEDGTYSMMTSPFYPFKKKGTQGNYEISDREIKKDENTYVLNPFSYYIQCKLVQPIDFQENYILNFSLHVRIWESRALIVNDKCYFPSGESTSIFLYKESDYYNLEDKVFHKIEIDRSKSEEKYGFKKNADRYFVNLINVNLTEAFTSQSADRLLQNGERVLITKKNTPGGTQRGAGLPERNELWTILTGMLPELKPRAKLIKTKDVRVSTSITYKKLVKDIGESDNNSITFNDKMTFNKYSYDQNSEYKKVRFYITTSYKDMYEKSIAILRLLLRLKHKKDNVYYFKEGMDIEIIQVDNAFCTTIDNSKVREKIITNISELYKEEDTAVLKLALIDLADYSKHNSDDSEYARQANKSAKKFEGMDPKNLIRSTCRESRVITQFIEYGQGLKKSKEKESALNAKLMNAIKDLLMAAGFFDQNIYLIYGKNQPELIKRHECMVGIGKISDSNNSSILCMSVIENGRIKLNIYGIGRWYQYDEAIYAMNSNIIEKSKVKIYGNSNIVRSSIAEWIQNNLDEIAAKYDRVYCFIDAVLRNNLWEWAKNGKFLTIAQQYHLADLNKVVFIRVNTIYNELPDYYVDKGKVGANRDSGVFTSNDDPGTYYLIARRSMIEHPGKDWTKFMAPESRIPRQRVVEINIQGCQDDEREDIALLTQLLRSVNITYETHTEEPWPLYCMRRLTEYIVAEEGKG